MCMNNCAAILPYLISSVRDEMMRTQVQHPARVTPSLNTQHVAFTLREGVHASR